MINNTKKIDKIVNIKNLKMRALLKINHLLNVLKINVLIDKTKDTKRNKAMLMIRTIIIIRSLHKEIRFAKSIRARNTAKLILRTHARNIIISVSRVTIMIILDMIVDIRMTVKRKSVITCTERLRNTRTNTRDIMKRRKEEITILRKVEVVNMKKNIMEMREKRARR